MVKNLTSMFEYLSDIVKSAYIILEKETRKYKEKEKGGKYDRLWESHGNRGIARSRRISGWWKRVCVAVGCVWYQAACGAVRLCVHACLCS